MCEMGLQAANEPEKKKCPWLDVLRLAAWEVQL